MAIQQKRKKSSHRRGLSGSPRKEQQEAPANRAQFASLESAVKERDPADYYDSIKSSLSKFEAGKKKDSRCTQRHMQHILELKRKSEELQKSLEKHHEELSRSNQLNQIQSLIEKAKEVSTHFNSNIWFKSKLLQLERRGFVQSITKTQR